MDIRQRMRSVIEAEAQVPLAMADAFRSGNMGIMDYARYRNIESDTQMRRAIAEGESDDALPDN